jgi:hypothetical protein
MQNQSLLLYVMLALNILDFFFDLTIFLDNSS